PRGAAFGGYRGRRGHLRGPGRELHLVRRHRGAAAAGAHPGGPDRHRSGGHLGPEPLRLAAPQRGPDGMSPKVAAVIAYGEFYEDLAELEQRCVDEGEYAEAERAHNAAMIALKAYESE